ncbi:MAG TPA: phenylacetate--CoA ligase family protein [Stenomitos sp.]
MDIVPALQTFLGTSLDNALQERSPEEVETYVLALFHKIVSEVPAYRTFLAEHNIDPACITSLDQFRQLPLTTKFNYLQQFDLAAVCRQGQLQQCDMVAVSSGSTGEPTFWLRSVADELAIATRFEQVFRDSFAAHERRTLAVVCFALGTWVGGLYTANCCRHLALKGYPITVVAPGNHKPEILRVVQKLAPLFEQTILLGYPPFLKDVIDTGLAQSIPWADYNMKWVMAGEVVSEEWRSLVGQRIGSTRPCFDSAALYGTADAGVLGNETPLSICIRRWLAQHPDSAKALFGESRLPTLVQYDPLSRFFEVQDGTLLFSGDNGIPLVRYHIADTGGLLEFSDLMSFLATQGFNPIAELDPQTPIRKLPFVYVFGRSQFVVSYFGANIYPENIAVGLEQHPICEWVTGKFVLSVQSDTDQNTKLAIAIELAPGIDPKDISIEAIGQSIQHHLVRLNSEFANYVPTIHQKPYIELYPAGDPTYFPIGVKHRYTQPSTLKPRKQDK